MTLYGQRWQPWGSHRLGSCSDTIAAQGCYMTVDAMILSDFGHPYDPDALNAAFKAHGIYMGGCLLPDNAPSRLHPDVATTFARAYPGAADLSQLRAGPGEQVAAEVDFDHNAANGIQTHFMRVAFFDGAHILVDDPYYPEAHNFATHYGSDPAKTIIKIIRWRGQPTTTGGADLDPTQDKILRDTSVYAQEGDYRAGQATEGVAHVSQQLAALQQRVDQLSAGGGGGLSAADRLLLQNALDAITRIEARIGKPL